MKKNKINWRHTLKNNLYMLRIVLRCRPRLFILYMLSMVMAALVSFFSYTYSLKYTVNALQAGRPLGEIATVLCVIFGAYLLRLILDKVFSYLMSLDHIRLNADMQRILEHKAAQVDLACFEDPAFYDTYIKAESEAADRALAVISNLGRLLYCVIYSASSITLVMSISPVFLPLALLPLALTAIIGRRQNRIKHEYSMRNKELERQRSYVRRSFYLKDFSGELRLTDMHTVMLRRMRDSVAEMKQTVRKYGFRVMLFRYAFDIAYQVVDTGAYIIIAYMALVSHTLPLGDGLAMFTTVGQLSGLLRQVGAEVLALDENSLYIDNLRDFLEYDVKIAEDASAPAAPHLESLEVRGLGFTYPRQSEPVLSDISLTIRAGERIALVGHNGAGKTTLIKLLLRMYDPTEGAILYNGRDIREYRLGSYRDRYGTVFQDHQLFAVSVAENVLLRAVRDEHDRAVVADALEKSGMSDKVAGLPRGMDTPVTREFDDDGAVFSGGEAQKLAIARILAGDSEIVIMDEPTSALDPIAEQQMYDNMFEACRGRTVIFISHRLSSAAMADRIYMLEGGRVLEQGTHAELLERGGRYADMWHKQADTYTSEDKEVRA